MPSPAKASASPFSSRSPSPPRSKPTTLSLYAAEHARLSRLPVFMADLMLTMDRSAWLRRRAIGAFLQPPDPDLFSAFARRPCRASELRAIRCHRRHPRLGDRYRRLNALVLVSRYRNSGHRPH